MGLGEFCLGGRISVHFRWDCSMGLPAEGPGAAQSDFRSRISKECKIIAASNMKTSINRRQFLKLSGISFLSLLLQQCGVRAVPTEIASETQSVPAPFASVTPSATPAASATPQPTATQSYLATAAIGQVNSYDMAQLRVKLEEMIQQLGGLADVIRPGARVTIKPNLTGTTWTDAGLPAPATELFVTHPALVQALCELLIDAGAGQIRIADGLGDEAIFQAWGYTDVAARVNAQLIDLCKPAPYGDFASFPVGPARQIYDVFYMNAALKEVDVFISFAKMKCHSTTGVTLSLKNLIGIAPISLYRRDESHNHRSAFHEFTQYDQRLPRVAIRPESCHAGSPGIHRWHQDRGRWGRGLGRRVSPGPARPGLRKQKSGCGRCCLNSGNGI